MTLRRLRRRWLSVVTAAMLVVVGGVATVWVTHDNASPLDKDCATVKDLGRQAHELATWMNTGLDEGTLDSNPGEIVERKSALSDKLRAAAHSVRTPQMKKPLTTWADAMALNAQLQREANNNTAQNPPPEWIAGAVKYNTMTDEALDALNQQCPGLKQTVHGS